VNERVKTDPVRHALRLHCRMFYFGGSQIDAHFNEVKNAVSEIALLLVICERFNVQAPAPFTVGKTSSNGFQT
jgi:hypothetical protein